MNPALTSLAVLVIVILSIPLLLWLVKRLSQLPLGDGNDAMQVQASLTVGARERIAVVKVGERTLVVGITGNSINLLTELDAPLPAPQAGAGGRNFASILKNQF